MYSIKKNFGLLNLVFFVILMNTFYFYSQNSVEINIPWLEPQTVDYNGREIKVPAIKDQSFNDLEPSFFWKSKIEKNKQLNLITFNASVASKFEIEYLNEFFPNLPSQPNISFQISKAGKEFYSVLDVKPFYREKNQIKKVISISFNVSEVSSNNFQLQKDFVANSVLKEGSGIWYKISINRDGVYKIDKSFLANCGINTTNLNPSHINIYGNGEGMLPEKNSLP